MLYVFDLCHDKYPTAEIEGVRGDGLISAVMNSLLGGPFATFRTPVKGIRSLTSRRENSVAPQAEEGFFSRFL
jgi:hypothetical protein